MQYFKLIDNNKIIGVITSDNFMCYSPIADCYLRANEEVGEYASYNGYFYRDSWMSPIKRRSNYKEVLIENISYEEYIAFVEAFKENQEPIEEDPIKEIEYETNEYQNPIDIASIEYIRTSKINAMSKACNQIIEAGFDITLSDNLQHHFSLTTQDQLNLMSLSQMAANGMEAIPYHADGEICKFYSATDISEIVSQATAFKIYHTTYYNALKNYINSLETIEEIAAITYGTVLPEEYQSDVLKSLIQ